MSERPWYKRYPSDFINGSLRLDLEEKGAYSMIIDLIHDKHGPIDNDARWLGRVFGCSTRKAAKLVDKLCAGGWIEVAEGQIFQDRAVSDSLSSVLDHRKLAESGAKGARKTNEKKARPPMVNDLDEKGPLGKSRHTRYHIPEPENKNSISDDLKKDEGRVLLKAETYEKARDAAPGYDIYYLEGIWKDWNKSKGFVPDNPDAAFLGFCRKHKENNPINAN